MATLPTPKVSDDAGLVRAPVNMPYKFATQHRDHSDLASGRVLYSRPGFPAFPIRLVSEVFQRCLAQRLAAGATGPVTVYDPCCGGAYHLSTLAFEHWNSLQALIASDIEPQALELATRNLGLLTLAGLDQRIRELTALAQTYGKDSHQAALQSAEALRARVAGRASQHPLPTQVFQASAFDAAALYANLRATRVDVVLTDLPYGRQSAWRLDHPHQAESPANALLQALRERLRAESIVAIAADKSQKISADGYTRLERFQVGKRQIVLLKPQR